MSRRDSVSSNSSDDIIGLIEGSAAGRNTRPSTPVTHEDLIMSGRATPVAGSSPQRPVGIDIISRINSGLQSGSLYKIYEEYLRILTGTTTHSKPSISSLEDLLSSRAIVIGENHESTRSKEFLIRNMEALKKSGYTTIFFEHFSADQSGDLLGCMRDQDRGNELSEEEFNFEKLAQEALKHGIAIVALDNTLIHKNSYFREGVKRTVAFNANAHIISQPIIEASAPDQKFIFFVGNSHLSAAEISEGQIIPGISDLVGGASISFCPSSDENHEILFHEEPSCILDAKGSAIEFPGARAQVIVRCSTTTPLSLEELYKAEQHDKYDPPPSKKPRTGPPLSTIPTGSSRLGGPCPDAPDRFS